MIKQAMFLTWQLWNALRFPAWRHPIFMYAHKPAKLESETSPFWRLLPGTMLVCIVLLAIAFPLPALVASTGLIIALPFLLILFNGTVLGAILVIGISTTIASAQNSNRFELMSMSEEGALEVSWLLATGTVHRHDWLKIVYRLLKWVLRLVLILLGMALLVLIFSIFTSESESLRQQQQFNFLYEVINISLLFLVLWLDHIQSLLVAVVLGILLPVIIRLEVQLASIATVLYLTIQFATYLAIFVVYRLTDIIFTDLWGNISIVSIAITLLSIVTFFLIREVIISILWRLIFARYDASIEEYLDLINNSDE